MNVARVSYTHKVCSYTFPLQFTQPLLLFAKQRTWGKTPFSLGISRFSAFLANPVDPEVAGSNPVGLAEF